MKAKKHWVLAIGVVCCIVLLSIKISGISIHEKSQIKVYGNSTLLGLKKVIAGCVVQSRTLEGTIESILAGTRVEFDAACFAMQTDLSNEMREALRIVGLEVLENSSLADEQTAYLQVDVVVRKIGKDPSIYAFSVHIQLTQLVQLVRNSKILTMAETWPCSVELPNIIFVASFDKLQKVIEKEVTIQVDMFVNDYLGANPKEKEAKRKNDK